MARKTKKELNEKKELFYRLKWNCLIRQNNYKQEYRHYIDLIKQRIKLEDLLSKESLAENKRKEYLKQHEERVSEIGKILFQYKTQSMPSPDIPITWRFIYIDKSAQGVREEISDGVGRFGELLFRIDFHQDVEVLWYELSKKIQVLQQSKELNSIVKKLYISKKKKIKIPDKCISIIEKKNEPLLKVFIFQKIKLLEKEFRQLIKTIDIQDSYEPHLYTFDRYFEVYDLINSKNKLTYKQIVFKLKKSGWYKNKPFKQAINLVAIDFKKACKLLNISKKIYEKLPKAQRDLAYSKKIAGYTPEFKEELEYWNKKIYDKYNITPKLEKIPNAISSIINSNGTEEDIFDIISDKDIAN